MGSLKKFSISVIFVTLLATTLALYFSFWQEPEHNFVPERDFGRTLFARTGIDDVRKFKDGSYIHGLSYYYFKASPVDINRLIQWLGYKKVDKIPSPESQVVEIAVSRAGWQFDWAAAEIYLAYFCNSPDAENNVGSVDLLLISKGAGIYVTQGIPIDANRASNRSDCESMRSKK